MAIRILRDARHDLRDVAKYYRAIPLPIVGRRLAARVVEELNEALGMIATMPLSRQEHPDLPGVRWVQFPKLPYLAFYLVHEGDVVVVAVEHSASDYAARVLGRAAAGP